MDFFSKNKFLTFSALFFLQAGCATDTITFNANQKATLSLVSLTDPSGEGQILGELPSTIELPKLEGKVVRIFAEGHAPQYWIAKDFVANTTKVNVSLVPLAGDEKGKGGAGKGASNNLAFRLLLKGYGAISKGNWSLGREFAAKLEELEPTIAAPHIITGIAYFSEGKKAEARIAFEKAFALDPDDAEIKKMIDAAK